jgi:sec-independent protein translocase protein TatA
MFDPSAPHIIILLIVVLLLFGSKRLPGAAQSIGKAMKNFKGEMKDMREDGDKPAEGAQPSPVQQPAIQQLPQPAAPDATQQQLADMQRQLAELQRQNVAAGGGAMNDSTPRSEAQPNQQPF